MSTLTQATRIVIDANISLAQVLPLSYSTEVETQMKRWIIEKAWIVVPALWEYEVVSGIRRACVNGILTMESARQSLHTLFAMRFEIISGTPARHQRALEWAERLGQSRAYDAQYLALAEELSAPLWTGDRRLVNSTQQAGFYWAHWIGDA